MEGPLNPKPYTLSPKHETLTRAFSPKLRVDNVTILLTLQALPLNAYLNPEYPTFLKSYHIKEPPTDGFWGL